MENPVFPIPKLPNDVIIEILTRLPVKPLLRFKCVCKSWRTLISSQQFVATHLQNSKLYANYATHKLILMFGRNLSLKQCSVNSLLYEPFSEAFDLSCSLPSGRNFCWVVGSCNGLICLWIDKNELFLWNPSTRTFKKVPDFGVKSNVGGYYAYGFGYDVSSDDYKVVGIFNNSTDMSVDIVQVYSLRNDEWKTIKNVKCGWLMNDPAAFANGRLYWIANQDYEMESCWDIVSLDLEKDEEGLEILRMPSYVKSAYYSRLGVSEEGSLYVMCSHLTCSDVWIKDGLGNGSWTKVLTIPYVGDFLMYSYKRALYVMKDGKVLLLCGSTFVIFDAEDGSYRYPAVRNSGEFVAVSTYLESLVSPLGMARS